MSVTEAIALSLLLGAVGYLIGHHRGIHQGVVVGIAAMLESEDDTAAELFDDSFLEQQRQAGREQRQ